MVERADIENRYPALTGVTEPDEWDAAIADAQGDIATSVWGDPAPTGSPLSRYDRGVVCLAAHRLFAAHPELVEPGPVQSESVGGVSRSYAVAAVGGRELSSTSAGREFVRLRRQLGLGYTVI